jgi:hypothetical protein
MPDLVSTILAKALVMLVQALLARLFMHLLRTGVSYSGVVAVAA